MVATASVSQSNIWPWRQVIRSRAFVFTSLALAGLACGFALASFTVPSRGPIASTPGILWPDGKALSEFQLRGHDGRDFGRQELLGRWSLLSFGYTSCPDVCPATLGVMAQVLDTLTAGGADMSVVQPVFISVDPERDGGERLGAWVEHFGPRFIGATADHPALQRLSTQLGVMYAANHGQGQAGVNSDYSVDHTASIMLIDPEARLVAIYGLPHSATAIAASLARLLVLGHADGLSEDAALERDYFAQAFEVTGNDTIPVDLNLSAIH